jgi:hypothetical protein
MGAGSTGFSLSLSRDLEQGVNDSSKEMMGFSPRSGQERTAVPMAMLGKLRRRKACRFPGFSLAILCDEIFSHLSGA